MTDINIDGDNNNVNSGNITNSNNNVNSGNTINGGKEPLSKKIIIAIALAIIGGIITAVTENAFGWIRNLLGL